MDVSERIFNLLRITGIEQKNFAKAIGTTPKVVSAWKSGTLKSYQKYLPKIAEYFDIPISYFTGMGVFRNWSQILEYRDSVFEALRYNMPSDLELEMFDDEKLLIAWLDIKFHYDFDEIALIKWFSFSVESVEISPINGKPDSEQFADVKIKFTNQFDTIIKRHYRAIAKRENISTDLLRERKSVFIPVLGNVAAGIPMEAIENVIDYEEIDSAMAADGDYFGLRIRGASMEPRIREGDVVIVRKQADADTGDVVVVLVNGEDATVKKLKKGPNGISLIPFNPAFDVMFFSRQEIDALPVAIIGRVVELRGKF